MRIRIVWTLVLSIVLGAAFQAAPSRATTTIGVSPSIVEVSGKAGASGEVDLAILNQGDEAFDVTIATGPFDRVDPALSVPDWLSVDQSAAHVDVASQLTLKVSIAVPESVPSGARYATVAITTVPPDQAENATAISGQLVVPFLITVEGKGKIKSDAEIEKFAPVLELDGRLGFRTAIRNDGNVHWQTGGKVIVKTGNGEDYGTLDVEQARIYPEGSQAVATTSTLPVQSGSKYRAAVEIDYGAKKPKKAETEFTFEPKLSVTGSACENLDRGPTVSANLVNDGDLGIITKVNMSVTAMNGPDGGQTGALGPGVLWPNDTISVDADLVSRLPTGDYMLTVSVQTGASADPIVQEIPFSIGGTGPNVAPICPQPEATPGT